MVLVPIKQIKYGWIKFWVMYRYYWGYGKPLVNLKMHILDVLTDNGVPRPPKRVPKGPASIPLACKNVPACN